MSNITPWPAGEPWAGDVSTAQSRSPHADRDRTEPHWLPFAPKCVIGCPKCSMQLAVDRPPGTRFTLIHEADGSHTFDPKQIEPERDLAVERAATPPIANMMCAFSQWLNGTYPADLSEEAIFWRRVGKIHEEAGEVRSASSAYLHENPRKPRGSLDDLLTELADCVGAALGAIEHLTGHEGRSLDIATERARAVCARVGVTVAPAAERDLAVKRAGRARVEATIRLLKPDHITPQGARILRDALADPAPEATEGIRDLIERGSLGTPEAKQLRATVSDEEVARVVARARELESNPDSPAPWEKPEAPEGGA